MSQDQIIRVAYYERQFLRTQDFIAEQAYHIGARRRHNLSHHEWGIACGLELVTQEGRLVLTPGIAIDGYGRELVLATPLLVDGKFQEQGHDELDFWLGYNRKLSQPDATSFIGCGTNGFALDSYWQELPELSAEKVEGPLADPRKPPQVPPAEVNFQPWQSAPDDPQKSWPVYLGRVHFDRTKPASPFTTERAQRPYIGLRGQKIETPSGEVRVELGDMFAVFGTPESTAPLLGITKDGIHLNQATEIQGTLTVTGGGVEIKPSTSAAPTSAEPWSIRHLETSQKKSLQVEFGNDNTDEMVVGVWPEDTKAFRPCLTIEGNGNVAVHGNLEVKGQITNEGIVRPAQISPEVLQALLAPALQGMGNSVALLDYLKKNNQLLAFDASAKVALFKAMLTVINSDDDAKKNITNDNQGMKDAFATLVNGIKP